MPIFSAPQNSRRPRFAAALLGLGVLPAALWAQTTPYVIQTPLFSSAASVVRQEEIQAGPTPAVTVTSSSLVEFVSETRVRMLHGFRAYTGAKFTARNALFTEEILNQPQTAVIGAGDAATFTVTVQHPTGATYQWQRKAAGSSTWVNLGNTAVYSGTGTGTLTVNGVAGSMTGDQFRCVVTVGGASTTSSAAVLYAPPKAAAKIARQPASQVIRSGQPATFSVTVENPEPTYTYQWKKGGTAISGATSTSYTIPAVQSSDQASYTLVISNQAGSQTYVSYATAALSVTTAGPNVRLETTVVRPDGKAVPIGSDGYAAGQVGDVVIIRTASYVAGTTSQHRIRLRRPAVDELGESAWSDDVPTLSSPAWSKVDRVDGGPGSPAGTLGTVLRTSFIDSGNEPFWWRDQPSTPVEHTLTMVLDAPSAVGDSWQVNVVGASSDGQVDVTNTLSVKALALAGPATVAPPANTAQKLVGAYINLGQLNSTFPQFPNEAPYNSSSPSRYAASSVRTWSWPAQVYPGTTALTWEPFWGSYPVTPIVYDVANNGGSAMLRNALEAVYLVPYGNTTRLQNLTEGMAYELMDVGVDFVVADHSNLLFADGYNSSGVLTNPSAQSVLTAMGTLRTAFHAAGTKVRTNHPSTSDPLHTYPDVKQSIFIGMTTQWYTPAIIAGGSSGDPSLEVTDTNWIDNDRLPRFRSFLQYLYDNFASDPTAWQYVNDVDPSDYRGANSGQSKPLLVLYVGTEGPAFGRYEQDSAGNFLAGNDNNGRVFAGGKINRYYLDKITISVGGVPRPIDQVFALRYAGAYLAKNTKFVPVQPSPANQPNPDNISPEGLWSYTEAAHSIAAQAVTTDQIGAPLTNGYDSVFVPVKPGFPTTSTTWPASFGNTVDFKDRYGRTLTTTSSPSVAPSDLANLGKEFGADSRLATRLPRTLMLGVWSELGSAGDEPLPQWAQTIIPNNKFGDYYSILTKTLVTQFKAATSAPTIAAQPVNRYVGNGTETTFVVVATGSPLPTHQWQKLSGGTWSNVTDGASYAGTTTGTLTVKAAAVTTGLTDQFRCVVANAVSSLNSSTVTLTVTSTSAPAPTLGSGTVMTSSYSFSAGAVIAYDVSATGSGTLSYQWSKDGKPVAGRTAASYGTFTSGAADVGTHTYSVAVTNSVPGYTPITVTATSALTITLPAGTAPMITGGSVTLDYTLSVGNQVNYTVTATGTGTLSYQWFRNGVAMDGRTGPSYGGFAATTGDIGSNTYSVKVTNTEPGKAPASITVLSTLTIN